MAFNNTFLGKKVLVTGNTGFKGSWLSTWLLSLGADVHGLANGVPTSPALFEAANHRTRLQYWEKDIVDLPAVLEVIDQVRPDFIFHLAAQPLVRLAYDEPAGTHRTNIVGTINVLEALRILNPACCVVAVTSDKAYDNVEWVWGYRETDHLGGKDPYSASKGAAELVIRSYFESYFKKPTSNVRLGVGRAGNVIGGGDWAKDRIVPDAIRAWTSGKALEVRSMKSTRPWQHVLEPLSGYLALAQKLAGDSRINGEPFNFGPTSENNFSVEELLVAMQTHWKGGSVVDVSSEGEQRAEARLLKLNCDKALAVLNWKPALTFGETAELVVNWYRDYYQDSTCAWQITTRQIDAFVKRAACRGIEWAVK